MQITDFFGSLKMHSNKVDNLEFTFQNRWSRVLECKVWTGAFLFFGCWFPFIFYFWKWKSTSYKELHQVILTGIHLKVLVWVISILTEFPRTWRRAAIRRFMDAGLLLFLFYFFIYLFVLVWSQCGRHKRIQILPCQWTVIHLDWQI